MTPVTRLLAALLATLVVVGAGTLATPPARAAETGTLEMGTATR